MGRWSGNDDCAQGAGTQKGDEGARRAAAIHGARAPVPDFFRFRRPARLAYWLVTGRSGGRTARPTLLVSVPNQTVFDSGS